jgi:hypothetical protein
VERGPIPVVGPPLHHVADVDDQRPRHGLHRDPPALPVVQLEAARVLRVRQLQRYGAESKQARERESATYVLSEDGAASVVRVRAASHARLLHWRGRVVKEPQRGLQESRANGRKSAMERASGQQCQAIERA